MNTLQSIARRPGVPTMVTAGMIGRFPMAVTGLGVTLLVVGATDSYALAGALAATTTLSGAVASPVTSRLSDSLGQRRVLGPLVVASSVSSLALVWAVLAGAPVAVWFAAALAMGLSSANVGAMMRARWAHLLSDPNELSAAYALETVGDEIAFVLGPILGTGLALGIAPWAPVVAGAAMLAVGGLLLATQTHTAPPPRGHQRGHSNGDSPLRAPGMVRLLVASGLMGGVFGAMNVCTIAFAERYGTPAATGALLAIVSVGSLTTGLFLASHRRTWTLTDQLRWALTALVAGLAPLPLLHSVWAYGGVALLAGMTFAAIMVAMFSLIERFAPAGRLTEALALAGSTLAVGSAAVVALCGTVIDGAGVNRALLVPLTCAIGAAASAWLGARRLRALEAAADQRSATGSPSTPDDRDRDHAVAARAQDHDQTNARADSMLAAV